MTESLVHTGAVYGLVAAVSVYRCEISLSDVDPGWARYPNGLIATGAATTLDDQLFEDVLCRMIVGLFWIENEKRRILVRGGQLFGSAGSRVRP